MNKCFFIIIFALLFLTGCGKTRELENRDYVMAIGIDDENGYSISASVSKPDKENSGAETMFTGNGESIEKAVENINGKTKGNIYMGLNRVMVVSEGFRGYGELINYFSNNVELSRDIVIVKAKDPYEILEAKNDDDSASKYIYNYFQDKKKVDMDRLMDYYNKGEEIVIPYVKKENERIVITGGGNVY